MKPTREHFMKLAGEAGFDYAPDGNIYVENSNSYSNINKEIEALCQRVWNEAIEVAVRECDRQADRARTPQGNARASSCAERINKLKVTP